MAEQIVELAPGESREVSFEAIPHEAKTYQVKVNGLSGSLVALPPPECTPGTIKCEGYDLYECTPSGKWMLVMKNSIQCGYEPPEAPPVAGGIIRCNQTFCYGGWFYACWPDGYGYPQFKADWCTKDTPPINHGGAVAYLGD